MRRSERGQATVEWSALGLMLALLFATAGFAVARTDAWGFGEGIVHAISCAVQGGCDGRDSLDLAYGDDVAALVRRYSPNVAYERSSAALPIDFRRCRKTECSDGSDAAREIDSSRAGLPVTAFTRVVDRRAAAGRSTCSTGSTTRRASPAGSAACSATRGLDTTLMIGRATRCGSPRAAT